MSKTLLPPGCYDVLPPFARAQSQLSQTLLSTFESYGYEQVAPPLLEYSEGLLSGRGASLSAQTFRVMDPAANKVMGIRPDITLQISRIAASRLEKAPRPLRLSYNGLILRLQGEQFKGDRQLRQTGIELIGPASPGADAEVILVAVAALHKAGITHLTIDLNLPGIVGSLLAAEKLDNDQLQSLFEAISHKDVSAIRRIPFAYQDALVGLINSAGPAASALAAIERLALPESAKRQCRELKEVVELLSREKLMLTIDTTESRGFDYHSGLSFSIFVPGAAVEVGRGGRYAISTRSSSEAVAHHHDEEATGFTLYVETLHELLPPPAAAKRVLVFENTSRDDIAKLHAQGYVTLLALTEYGAGEDEAKRLGCGWIYSNGQLKELK